MRFIFLFLVMVQSIVVLTGQCIISDMTANSAGCGSDGLFDVVIDFNFVGQSDSFRVQGNGVNYGFFAYSDLPIIISNLEGNCITPYEFVARDKANPSCSDFVEFGVICCNQDCSLEITDIEVSGCNNNAYNLSIDIISVFGEIGTALVSINNELFDTVSFADFPYRWDDVLSLNDEQNFVIVSDANIPQCGDTLYFDSPCVCKIGDINHRIVDCNEQDSTYSMLIDFATNLVSDSFSIGGNNTFLGTFAYANLPLVVGPTNFHKDSTFFFIVDKRNTFCFNEYDRAPVIVCDTMCNLSNPSVKLTACEDGLFNAHIAFDYHNPSLKGFSIVGNGRVYADSLSYGQAFYDLGPLNGDCSTIYEFLIADLEFSDCRAVIELEEPVCCEICIINDLHAEVICGGDQDSIYINFNGFTSQDTIFDLEINGVFVGSYLTRMLPITIPLNFDNAALRVLVEMQSNGDCSGVVEIANPCVMLPCFELTSFSYMTSDCEEGRFNLGFEFDTEGMHSDSFYILLRNRRLGPFAYDKDRYIIEGLESNCEPMAITISDQNRPDCQETIVLEDLPCCKECKIINISLDPFCFELMPIGFESFISVEGQKSRYTITFNNEKFGPFSYDEAHTITSSGLMDGVYRIFIEDIEFGCTIDTFIAFTCNEVLPCGFTELDIEAINCNSETFAFLIDFAHSRMESDLFDIFINDQYKGTSSYSLLPVSSGILDRADGGPWDIVVRDKTLAECQTTLIVEEELCESGLYELDEDRIHTVLVGTNLYINSQHSITDVKMLDLSGKLCLQLSKVSDTIDISTLRSGMYILELQHSQQRYRVKVVIP